jgi:hypothetical protein
MSPAAHGSQDIVGAGQAPPRIPAETWLSPRRRGAPPGNCRALKHGACSDQNRARRAEVDTLITRAENPNVRANIAASVRRALRAPTMARCVLRALETRRDGRMANGQRQISRDPRSLFAPRHSPTFVFFHSRGAGALRLGADTQQYGAPSGAYRLRQE